MKSQLAIKEAIEILNSGGIIIYPTDTAFGMGCRIDKHEAVDRFFRIRKRPTNKPTPILVSSKDMALTYFDSPSKIVRRLMDTHWPGALTIVAKAKIELLYSPIRGNTDTVGIRMPDHQTILSIIKGVGVPIIGSSANFHGAPTPYRVEDLDSGLVELVDDVAPGECKVGNISTVVDCTTDPYTIVRQGAVKL